MLVCAVGACQLGRRGAAPGVASCRNRTNRAVRRGDVVRGRAGQRAGGQSNCGFGGGRSLGVSHLAAKPARNAPPVRRSQLCAHRPAGHTFLPRRAARFVIQKRSGAPALALPASASTFMSRPEAIGNRQQLALRRSSVQYSIQSTSSMFQASNCLQQHCSSAASSFFFEPERAGMPARQERMEGR
jgi:hypothetical protein